MYRSTPISTFFKRYRKNQNLIYFLLLAIAVSTPAFFFQKQKFTFSAPSARSGDEPHYLVMLNSIVLDFDLDLKNNYAMRQYGRLFQDLELDHHSYIKLNSSPSVMHEWNHYFSLNKNDNGYYFKPVKNAKELNDGLYRELPLHPPGYPVLLAVFSFPVILLHFKYYETLILLLQLIFFSFSIAVFRHYFNSGEFKNHTKLFTILSLSSPIWVLSASFYPESLIGGILLLSLLHFSQRKTFLLGIECLLLTLIKDTYIPAAALINLMYLVVYRFKKSDIRLYTASAAGLLLYIAKNFFLFGNPFKTYIPFEFNSNFSMAGSQFLTSSDNGILSNTPHFILFPWVAWNWYKNDRKTAVTYILILAAIGSITVLHKNWSGGPSFSYRTIAPVLFYTFPFFILPGKFYKTILFPLLTISFLNMLWAISSLQISYQSYPYLNIISPQRSIIYEKYLSR